MEDLRMEWGSSVPTQCGPVEKQCQELVTMSTVIPLVMQCHPAVLELSLTS